MTKSIALITQDVMALKNRFLSHAFPDPNSGCWLWGGATDHEGYGTFRVKTRTVRAHRVAYEIFTGPIPGDLVIDHLCRVRCCVNPDHLEPVTFLENIRRGSRILNGPTTQCKRGHPIDHKNLYVDPRGKRDCRKCRNEATIRYHAKMKSKAAAAPKGPGQ